MTNNKKLTRKQNDILTYIKKFIANNSYPPSIREICSGLNLKSPATVHVHINNIIDKGYLRRSNNGNHSLELLIPNEYITNDIVSVPLLGKITAGNPIEAISNPDEYFNLPKEMVPSGKSIFTLKVSGDSMINVGIHDGDIIIVEAKNTANNKDIVVAMNDENEVTLKTFYKEDGYFRLQPENDFMTPIILKSVTILGKAIGLYRKI